MFGETHFHKILFILTYVSCTIYVTCNDESSKAYIHTTSNGTVAINKSNNSFELSEKPLNESEKIDLKSISLERGSKTLIREKNNNTTVSTPMQNDPLNDKSLLEAVQNSYSDTNTSSDHKPHKGRKGVDINEMKSEEFPVEHSTLQAFKSTDSVKESVNSANNTTAPISSVVISGDFTTKSSNPIPAIEKSKNVSLEFPNQKIPNVNITSSINSFIGDQKYKNILNDSTENKLDVGAIQTPSRTKPITRDDEDVDDRSSFSLTNPENDYIIPVVATIFAAPLLVVLGMFLYKRSKEYWERRHYRRMDFLIDGMYND